MRIDDCDVDVPEPTPEYGFRLAGREWTVRHRSVIPLALMGSLLAGDGVRTSDVFAQVLTPADAKAMTAVLETPPEGLTYGRIDLAVRGIWEYVIGFPTTPPSDSSAGRKPTPKRSAGGSSSPGRRRTA